MRDYYYLLPCQCGRKLPVEAAHAGEVIQCECGASIEIPTMRALAALERVEAEPASSDVPGVWDTSRQILVLGAAITLIGAFLTSMVYWGHPLEPPPLQIDYDRLQAATENLTLDQSFELWDLLKKELRRDPRFDEQRYVEAMVWHRRWLGVALAVLALGIMILVAGLLLQSCRKNVSPTPANRA